ncbi:MAG: oxygen-independent coproporphyrinogen-3 oxidase [Bermanella sp.]|jgi:oxygen-independent coproporphyrinogen-3 oxidase|uniref:oxygen-independent coproporphyrinogen III oxidase n=1 Tax=Glaciecola sp. 33A TaxID=2057807 RepID=UPI000C32EDF5|nr:oxygen-independent coproporphyrinogen III oxidase [Glaciecola sp. 33A]PKI02219.1 oxygen-independent coproporphyrinogen III oxidase [Glaciecola sp. 33A]
MADLKYFDKKVLNKYNTAGPRYTSYPTALSFHDEFTDADFEFQIKQKSNSKSAQHLSLYLHIPFCHSLCYYCGCNKIVTRQKDRADKYLEFLFKEISHRGAQFTNYKISQLHLGGGTPSFLDKQQLARLMAHLQDNFRFNADVEASIEIDPREIKLSYVDDLAAVGFNRLSIGVQDTNREVQVKINRVQSTEFINALVTRAKEFSFSSINLDLIYGLPMQTFDTFLTTLQKVVEIDPDRISLFSYAHMPQQFPAQRKIKDEWLPSAHAKFDLLRLGIEFLTKAGYVFIGMDHFAKPNDELSKALNAGHLHRNFQGYTPKQHNALLGLGVSSISSIENIYAQNTKDLKTYYEAIENKQSALIKGLVLNFDDKARRAVIHSLMCNFQLSKKEISEQFGIDFDDYFAKSIADLSGFERDGLISMNDTHIRIADRGRLLVRNICMSFDQHLSQHAHNMRYSRVI